MQNPPEAPQWRDARFKDDAHSGPPELPPTTSLAHHVGIVSILMIVQGVLEVFMGLFCIGMAALMPAFFRLAAADDPEFKPPGMGDPELMFRPMMGIYVIIGLMLAAVGAFRIFAGWRNYRFRNWTLGIVAMAVGMVAVFGCYCGPTAVVLAVYGLIVFLNPHVKAAFASAESAQSEERAHDVGSPFRPSPP